MFDAIFINLDESIKRRLAMERSLENAINTKEFKRFAAVNGDSRPAGISINELGCFLSHQRVIEFANSNIPTLILEDDVIFSKNFKDDLELIIRRLYETSTSWDMLFLAQIVNISNLQNIYNLLRLKRDFLISGSQSKNFRIIPCRGYYSSGATSYVVNPTSRDKISSLVKNFADNDYPYPIDIVFNNLIQQKLVNAYFIFPYLTGVESVHQSTIHPNDAKPFKSLLEDQLNLFFIDSDIEYFMSKYKPDTKLIYSNDIEHIMTQIIFNRLII